MPSPTGSPPLARPPSAEILRHSATRWLTSHLLDPRHGGVYRAAPAAGGRPIAGDKHLPDQSAAVLALADGALRELPVALRGLHALLDRDGLPGFAELADRSWRALPAGRVRTLRHQLNAATALLVGSRQVADPVGRVRAVDLLNRCLSTCRDGYFPESLTADWRQAVDGGPSPQTTIAAVRAIAIAEALGESEIDTEQLPRMAANLGRHVQERAVPGGRARIALAMAHAARLLDSAEHLDTAHRTVGLAVRDFTHREGAIRFSADEAADLLLAGAVLSSCGREDRRAIAVSGAAIARLADRRHGGFHTVPAQVGQGTAVKYARVQSVLAGALGAASALPPSRKDWPVDDVDA